jgi:hypothetical protein
MTHFVKYPKTMHLPWSPGLQNDDRRIESLDFFKGKEVIVTEKMDGENTTMYRDAIHARSIDGRHHPSRDWVKAFHGQIKYDIPNGFRICGENVYAEHSIHYVGLETYFYGFSAWHNSRYDDICVDWELTTTLFDRLGITPVRELWRGPWELFYEQHESLDNLALDQEGYVVRVTDPFSIEDFQKAVAKYVRKDHIQTDQHWMSKPVVPNGLRKE